MINVTLIMTSLGHFEVCKEATQQKKGQMVSRGGGLDFLFVFLACLLPIFMIIGDFGTVRKPLIILEESNDSFSLLLSWSHGISDELNTKVSL